jgi:hypothetical protein
MLSGKNTQPNSAVIIHRANFEKEQSEVAVSNVFTNAFAVVGQSQAQSKEKSPLLKMMKNV